MRISDWSSDVCSSDLFTNYLTKVSPAWKDAVGEGKSVQWPDGVGGKGNEGVASYVQQIDGSIGYVELAYALQNKMAYAMMRNAAGNFVAPSAEAFAAAAATADWSSVDRKSTRLKSSH